MSRNLVTAVAIFAASASSWPAHAQDAAKRTTKDEAATANSEAAEKQAQAKLAKDKRKGDLAAVKADEAQISKLKAKAADSRTDGALEDAFSGGVGTKLFAGPVPDVPSSHPALVLACAKVLACTGDHDLLEQCVTANLHPGTSSAVKTGLIAWISQGVLLDLRPYNACLGKATDCKAVGVCLSGGEPCGKAPDSCDGSRAKVCNHGLPMTLDCSRYGLQCLKIQGDAACGHPIACSAEGASCHGDKLHICAAAKDGSFSGAVVDCGALGQQCEGQRCQPKRRDPPCGDTFRTRCDGNVRLTCEKGSVQTSDCGAEGMNCAEVTRNGARTAICTYGAGCEGPSRCDGTRLSYCESGTRTLIDCAAGDMICGKNPTTEMTGCRFGGGAVFGR